MTEDSLIDLAEIIDDLNDRWEPHPGQIPIGRALFYERCKNVFVSAGKNFGKTELASYCTWRWALENSGSENYIIEPFSIQAKEILWASKRIQTFGNPEYIDSENNSEMRLNFKNGSFIKLLGSDNEIALQGIKPHGIIVYDEIKDHRRSAINLMEPNRAAFDVPALFIGTPPEIECYFVELMELAKRSPDWRFFNAPTETNPYISTDWLRRKKEELISMGEEETWLRDYMAIYVKGGKNHIIPQAVKYQTKPINQLLPTSFKHWELLVLFDPAAASVFAVIFVLFNQYTRKSIFLHEIYETNQADMTVRSIWASVFEITKTIRQYGYTGDIRYVYDEAETWFRNETYEFKETSSLWLEPTQKATNDKMAGIALLRDVFNKELIEISDQCPNFKKELDNYIKDEKGRIPKKSDHCIDLARYHLHAVGYSLDDKPVPAEANPLLEKRFTRLDEELILNSLSEFDLSNNNNSLEEL